MCMVVEPIEVVEQNNLFDGTISNILTTTLLLADVNLNFVSTCNDILCLCDLVVSVAVSAVDDEYRSR